MEKILREILDEDRTLLFRGNELIVALERKLSPNSRRQFTSIKAALKLDVGRFFATEKDDFIGRYKAIKNLVEGGISEEKINFVLKTFENALSDDSTDVAEIPRLKNRIAELEVQIKSAPANPVDEIFKEKSVETTNDVGRKFIWDSDKPFVLKNS